MKRNSSLFRRLSFGRRTSNPERNSPFPSQEMVDALVNTKPEKRLWGKQSLKDAMSTLVAKNEIDAVERTCSRIAEELLANSDPQKRIAGILALSAVASALGVHLVRFRNFIMQSLLQRVNEEPNEPVKTLGKQVLFEVSPQLVFNSLEFDGRYLGIVLQIWKGMFDEERVQVLKKDQALMNKIVTYCIDKRVEDDTDIRAFCLYWLIESLKYPEFSAELIITKIGILFRWAIDGYATEDESIAEFDKLLQDLVKEHLDKINSKQVTSLALKNMNHESEKVRSCCLAWTLLVSETEPIGELKSNLNN